MLTLHRLDNSQVDSGSGDRKRVKIKMADNPLEHLRRFGEYMVISNFFLSTSHSVTITILIS